MSTNGAHPRCMWCKEPVRRREQARVSLPMHTRSALYEAWLGRWRILRAGVDVSYLALKRATRRA